MRPLPIVADSPKILPWLARRADIPIHRAESLWRAALRHAAHETGERDTSVYWRAAMDRLLELIAAESQREDEASFGWRRWARTNANLWQVPLAVLDSMTVQAARCWQNLRPPQFG
jgi:hypothetical protein